MLLNHKLKKLGYKKEDLNGMRIEDILKLGEMGYTKAEIDAMSKEPENDVNAQIASLKEQIEKLTNTTQIDNVRKPVEDVPTNEDIVNEALKVLGGGNNG